jgi:hypothetical protein
LEAVITWIARHFPEGDFGTGQWVTPTQFYKRRQLLIRVHNETLSIVAICVSNEVSRHL